MPNNIYFILHLLCNLQNYTIVSSLETVIILLYKPLESRGSPKTIFLTLWAFDIFIYIEKEREGGREGESERERERESYSYQNIAVSLRKRKQYAMSILPNERFNNPHFPKLLLD